MNGAGRPAFSLHCSALPYPTLPCSVLPFLALPCPLHCSVLPYPTLTCPVLPCTALPCPAALPLGPPKGSRPLEANFPEVPTKAPPPSLRSPAAAQLGCFVKRS